MKGFINLGKRSESIAVTASKERKEEVSVTPTMENCDGSIYRNDE